MPEEMPPRFTPFTSTQYTHKELSQIVSRRRIPFDLALSLKECLKEDYSQQFNLNDSVAHLVLLATSVCLQCSALGS